MGSDDTRVRILDAALTVMSRFGLSRLSVEEVARVGNVSRQTIYRYVGSRDGLVTATILREEEAFLERLRAAVADHAEFRPALTAAIGSVLTSAREHPLLDRLLDSEPEALLPFLTDGSGPVLSAARTVVVEVFGDHVPQLSEAERAIAADAVTRMMVSYAISPPATPTEELAGHLADLLIDGVAAMGHR